MTTRSNTEGTPVNHSDTTAGSPAPLPRPQPLGVLDDTAGLILVPAGDGTAELLDEIARLGHPDGLPDA